MSNEWVKRIRMLGFGIIAYVLGLFTMWMFTSRLDERGQTSQDITTDNAEVIAEVAKISDEKIDDSNSSSGAGKRHRDPRERIPWEEWVKVMERTPNLEQLEEFVEDRHRSAESLIAASSFELDGGAYLKEAMERFSDSALVQFVVLTSTTELTNEERLLWAERLKASMPENAVASILAANAKVGAGDLEGSLEELRVASQQRKFDDLQSTLALERTDALLHTGIPYPEARFMSGTDQGRLIRLIHDTAQALQKDLIPSLTGVARNDAIALGLALGNRLSEGDGSGDPAVELAGMTIENRFLSSMEADEHPAFLEMDVAEAKASVLEQRKSLLHEIKTQSSKMMDSEVSEYELLQFYDRVEEQGRLAALEWMKQAQGSDK